MKNTDRGYLRNISFLLIGQAVTLFGSQIFTFYTSYFILKETGSGLSFGLSTALGLLPQLFIAPIGGFIADSYSRKKIIVFTDLISGLFLLIVLGLSYFTGFKMYYLYISVFVLGVLSTIDSIVLSASLPNIVEKTRLVKLNSLSQTVASLSRVSAPFIGSLFVEIADIRIFTLINAVSFLIAALMEYFIIFREDIRPNQDIKSFSLKYFFTSLKEGAEYTKGNKPIFYMTFFVVFFSVALQLAYSNPMPYIINTVINLPAVEFGAIQSIASLGAILASLAFAFLNKPEKLFNTIITASAVMTAVWFLIGFFSISEITRISHDFLFPIYMLLNLCFGMAVVIISIPSNILIQSHSADEYRGRVMGIMDTVKSSLTPLAAILSGFALDNGEAYIMPFFGAFLLIIIAFTLRNKRVYY